MSDLHARNNRSIAALALVAAALLVGACKSGGPEMTGLAIGGTHFVKVGDLVEVRLPLREDGSREWRVTSYDSLYLTVADRPQVVQENGKRVILLRARAKTPGETKVEVTEVAPPGDRAPRMKTFKVRISS